MKTCLLPLFLCFLHFVAIAQRPDALDKNVPFEGIKLGTPRPAGLPAKHYEAYNDGLVDVFITEKFKEFEGSRINEFLIYEDCCNGKNIFRLHLYFDIDAKLLQKLEKKYGKGISYEKTGYTCYKWIYNSFEIKYLASSKEIKLIFKFLEEDDTFDAW